MNPTESRDPVHMDPDGSWWFYDCTWAGRYGPYPTPDEARAKLQDYAAWLNSNQQPAAERPVETELDMAVAEYMRLRDEKAATANRHKEELAAITDQLDKADAFLLGKLQELGVQSFKAGGATVFYATELRAGIIVGPGSAAFEVMRDMVYNLPVLTPPRWVRSKSSPIARMRE